jgi:DNA mismatch repair ATPase MutS/predicted GIY-YIG superfamily endonuclease
LACENIKKLIEIQKKKEEKIICKLSSDILKHESTMTRISLTITGFLLKHCVYNTLACSLTKKFTLSPVEKITTEFAVSSKQMFPYWIERDEERKMNDIELKANDVTILTAPNTNGKSTFLRSILANSVLSNAGFPVSAESFATNVHFSEVKIRFPAKDRPKAKLSSFASEVVDMKNILETTTKDSIICFDEFLRGTSNIESMAVCTALIEQLKNIGSTVIFSTHLFELLERFENLPRLTISKEFKISEGYTKTSEALSVLKKHELDETFIRRVEYLLKNRCVQEQEEDQYQPAEEDVQQDDEAAGEILTNFEKTIVVCRKMLDDIEINVFEHDVMLPTYVLNSKACLYMIEETDGSVYVGESSNVIRRRKEHQDRNSDRNGRIAVIALADKSMSLEMESRLIRICISEKILLSSVTDGFHK